VEVGGGGAEDGESEAVEAGEDVGFDDISRDGGDHGGAACIGGGGSHLISRYMYIANSMAMIFCFNFLYGYMYAQIRWV